MGRIHRALQLLGTFLVAVGYFLFFIAEGMKSFSGD